MNWKKRILKHSIAAVVIVALALLTELLIFNSHALNNKGYTDTYKEKSKGTEGFAVRKYGEEKAAVLVFDKKYINKISIAFDTEEDVSYKIELTAINKFDKEYTDTIRDKAYGELKKSYINVGKSCSKIKIIYPKDAKLNSISVSNKLKYNPFRILFLIFTLGLFYSFFTCRRLVANKIEYAFLMSALFLGSVMVIALPENFKSWDEQIHFNRAYMYSFDDTVEYTEAAWRLKTLDVPEADTIEERKEVCKMLNDEDEYGEIVKELEKDSNFITYGGRAYILQAFALWLARECGWKLTTGIVLARYFNLITYVIIMFFAIKCAHRGKRILTIIGLLPTSLFLAASFSYDAYVTAFLTFGFVMVVNEFTYIEEKINWKRILAGVLGIVVGSFAKAVYIPLILFLCFLPKEKFVNKKQKWMFKISIIIVFLVMMSTFVLPAITNVRSGVDAGGDARGGDTSVTRQLESVMEHPVEYAELFISSVVKTAPEYFLGHSSRTLLGYLGRDSGTLFYFSLLITVFVAFTEGTMGNCLPLSRKSKFALAGVIFCIIGLIWTALYLDFTPVGLNMINGVQARYYIPLMFPAILIIENGRVRCNRVSEFRYNQIVLYGSVIVLSGMIYKYILVQCCF
ncbi:MAG: DUF2142 domain-containing protein [Lachnospiraceae bacterium]|nr:DUF2142 domain-containing protein [Lachnospiraceae bacterium]